MDVYESETKEVIRRFLLHQLSFPGCIAAVDAALADLVPSLTAEQLARLRVLMLANTEIVRNEMERRAREDYTSERGAGPAVREPWDA
jgi:hypothetical protein